MIPNIPGLPPNLPVETGSEDATVLLHATEYSALTMRATYLDAFSNAVWALMVGYLTLLVNLWSHVSAKVLLSWGSAIAVQIMLLVIGFFTFDRYVIVAYIQKHLIPIVSSEVRRTNIWEWEKFLYTRRGKRAFAWEWPPALVAFGCPALVIAWRRFAQWGWIDWGGIAVTLLLALATLRNIVAIIRVRYEWEQTFVIPPKSTE